MEAVPYSALCLHGLQDKLAVHWVELEVRGEVFLWRQAAAGLQSNGAQLKLTWHAIWAALQEITTLCRDAGGDRVQESGRDLKPGFEAPGIALYPYGLSLRGSLCGEFLEQVLCGDGEGGGVQKARPSMMGEVCIF